MSLQLVRADIITGEKRKTVMADSKQQCSSNSRNVRETTVISMHLKTVILRNLMFHGLGYIQRAKSQLTK
jgi:hypothetical protein